MAIHTTKKLNYSSDVGTMDAFSLVIRHRLIHTKIDMNVLTVPVNTRDIPWTFDFLKQNLPSILLSSCFNDEKIPFSVEVTRTELGHLFEHILLEYLCEEKIRRGWDEAVFSGRTNWNWEREPFGLFHIYIDMQRQDREIFPEALEKSIFLFKNMLQHNQPDTYSYPLLPLTQPLEALNESLPQ
jgi:hypothetical protein